MSSRAEIDDEGGLHHPPMRFDESPSFLNINVTTSAPSHCLESRSRGNQNPNIFTSDRAR